MDAITDQLVGTTDRTTDKFFTTDVFFVVGHHGVEWLLYLLKNWRTFCNTKLQVIANIIINVIGPISDNKYQPKNDPMMDSKMLIVKFLDFPLFSADPAMPVSTPTTTRMEKVCGFMVSRRGYL